MNKEKKEMNDQLIIEQLRAENELKTKWLSLLAHDCRGVLSNIKLLLDALESKSISQEIFMSMIPEIKQINEKNTKTLQNTLTWINSQVDGFSPHIEDVPLRDLFLQVENEFYESIQVKELSIDLFVDQQLSMQTDRFLLMFVLRQIVENAIKYSNRKGEIKLKAHLHLNEVNITIQDNGVGMKDSVVNNIGTLSGSPCTGTMQEKGAGLSLVIVKDFVELLNGKISIVSLVNQGSSVLLTFPQHQKP